MSKSRPIDGKFRITRMDQWDQDFVVVRPGQRIVARNDERVLDVE